MIIAVIIGCTIAVSTVLFWKKRKLKTYLIICQGDLMTKFLDSHDLKGVNPKDLKKLQNAPKDEFEVSHLNIIYSEEEDKCYCLLDAPDKESVAKHHEKMGYKCDFIMQVEDTLKI